MSSARPARALAALRQLATLGLPGKTVMPEAIELLRASVGFETAGAFHFNHRYQIVDAHIPSDLPLAVVLDYADNFFNRPDHEGAIGPTAVEALKGDRRTIHTSCFIERSALMKTAFWNRVLRPAGVGWMVRLPLRNGRLPLANVHLSRPFDLRDFSAADIRLLEQAQPWLSHALARDDGATQPNAEPAVPTGECGFLILGPTGNILSASAGAIALLHLAVGAPLEQSFLQSSSQGDARVLLKRLALAVGASLIGEPAVLPAATIHNANGTFSLRAYALDPFAPGMPTQVSLHIERRVPLSLRLFRSPRFLALSARERDVCLALLANRSLAEIAQQLGIKRSSVIHHTKLLYQRLNIAGQKDLLPALLGEALP